MAAIDWAAVVKHAPELSGINGDAQDDILAYVNDTLAVEFFGGETSSSTKMARIYLAAHLGTVAKSRGLTSSGAVTSETAGRLVRSYAAIAAAVDDLDSSSYGRQYRGLVKRSSARVPFVP